MYMLCLLPVYVTEQIAKHNNFTTQIVSNMNRRTPKEYKQFIENQIDIDFTYPFDITQKVDITSLQNSFDKACYCGYICYKNKFDKNVFFAMIKNFTFTEIEQQAIDLFKQDIISEEDLSNIDCSLEVKIRLATLLGFFYEIDNTYFSKLFLWAAQNLDVFYFLSIKEYYKNIHSNVAYFNLDYTLELRNLKPKIYLKFLDDCNAYTELLKYKDKAHQLF